MLKRVYYGMIILIAILGLNHCVSSIDAMEKQTKLDACFKILKQRTTNNILYFNRLVDLFNSLGGDDDKTQKVLFLTLCSCYNTISFDSANQIAKQPRLNISDDEIISLSTFELWEGLMLSKDQEKIASEISTVNNAFEEIKRYDLDISKLQSDFKSYHRVTTDYIKNKLLLNKESINGNAILLYITIIVALCLIINVLKKYLMKSTTSKSKTN